MKNEIHFSKKICMETLQCSDLRGHLQTTLTTRGEGHEMSTLLNEFYQVKLPTRGEGVQKSQKLSQHKV